MCVKKNTQCLNDGGNCTYQWAQVVRAYWESQTRAFEVRSCFPSRSSNVRALLSLVISVAIIFQPYALLANSDLSNPASNTSPSNDVSVERPYDASRDDTENLGGLVGDMSPQEQLPWTEVELKRAAGLPELDLEIARDQEALQQSQYTSDEENIAGIVEELEGLITTIRSRHAILRNSLSSEELFERVKKRNQESVIIENEFGRAKINWVNVGAKGEGVIPSYVYKLEPKSGESFTTITYDPREVDPETNAHLKQYISRIIVNRQKDVILLAVRDGEIVGADIQTRGSPISPRRVRHWVRATLKAPTKDDVRFSFKSAGLDAMATLVAFTFASLGALISGIDLPSIDNILKVSGFTMGYSLLIAVLYNTVREIITRGSRLAQLVKGALIVGMPFNLLVKIANGEPGEGLDAINPYTEKGMKALKDSTMVLLFSQWAKTFRNDIDRVRTDTRQNEGHQEYRVPFTQRKIKTNNGKRFESQILLRIPSMIIKMLGLIGLGSYEVVMGPGVVAAQLGLDMETGLGKAMNQFNSVFDSGDFLTMGLVVVFFYIAVQQSIKHNHVDKDKMKAKWDRFLKIVLSPVTVPINVAKGLSLAVTNPQKAYEYLSDYVLGLENWLKRKKGSRKPNIKRKKISTGSAIEVIQEELNNRNGAVYMRKSVYNSLSLEDRELADLYIDVGELIVIEKSCGEALIPHRDAS